MVKYRIVGDLSELSLVFATLCLLSLYEGVNGVPLKSVISKTLAKKSVISKI